MPTPTPEPFAEDFNVVLLGNLNAAIFHPEWLARHGLIGQEAAATAEVVVVSPQITEFTVGQVSFHCDDSKMQISSNQAVYSEQVLDMVCGIVRILPHMPLGACGINHEARYHVNSLEYWHAIGHGLIPKFPIWTELSEEPGTLKVSIKSPITTWEYPIEENFSVEPFQFGARRVPSIVVRCNTHFGVPSNDISTACLIESFLTAYWSRGTSRACQVANKIFEHIVDPSV